MLKVNRRQEINFNISNAGEAEFHALRKYRMANTIIMRREYFLIHLQHMSIHSMVKTFGADILGHFVE